MIYSKAVVDIVCELIVEGHSLRMIGKVKGLPSKATLMRWLNDPRKIAFLDAYRRAKQVQHCVVVEDLLDLVDSGWHYKSLGRLGGRVHKLHLKSNARPANALEAELERRARLKYSTI